MKIGVIGATGILGRNVVPRLLANGHTVRAIVRREASAPRFAAIGAEIALADIFDTGAFNTTGRPALATPSAICSRQSL